MVITLEVKVAESHLFGLLLRTSLDLVRAVVNDMFPGVVAVIEMAHLAVIVDVDNLSLRVSMRRSGCELRLLALTA